MTNKVILVTGAAKRIGRELSMHLAAQGYHVALHYNTSKKLILSLQADLQKKFPNQSFKIFQCNLEVEGECEKLIDTVMLQYEKLDVLINNASVFDPGIVRETTVDLFNSQMNVNLKAPFILSRDFALNTKKGVIINFLDTRITSNGNSHAAYSISKVALAHLTKMSALEFGPFIRVNGIAPGATLPPEGYDETYLSKIAEKTPMKVPGGLEPILQSVDYILNNKNLTGQILFCDGGEQLL